ncbi:MAG: copper chaperone PCu(A)C [Magnetospirillum sp.]|nr:copper chaperone PCu(A)C [Magnetospirillum sp.]
MKKFYAAALGMLAATGVLIAEPASTRANELRVESAWARASAGRNGAAFVTVYNGGNAPDRLVGVASPVAPDVMVHRSFEEDGTMKMEHVAAIPIANGQRIEMKPGGLHIMLVNLKQPLKKGDQFPLSLTFERGGTKETTVTVYGPGAMEPK